MPEIDENTEKYIEWSNYVNFIIIIFFVQNKENNKT